MKERNESLDCLKGIAILLVMFGHVQVHNHMTDPYLYDLPYCVIRHSLLRQLRKKRLPSGLSG